MFSKTLQIFFVSALIPVFVIAQDPADSSVKKKSTVSKLQDLFFGKKGWGPIASYSNRDHIHVGIRYGIVKTAEEGARVPQTHLWAVRYSISEKAPSYEYEASFKELLGKWDLDLSGGYDHIRWHNFFGTGNHSTIRFPDERDYHRVQTREIDGYLGLSRTFGNQQLRAGFLYSSVKLLNDPGRYHTEFPPQPLLYKRAHFGGGALEYVFKKLDHLIVPTRGVLIRANANYLNNLKNDSAVLRYGVESNLFAPLGSSLVFYMRTGVASLSGKPEFYQLHRLGGSRTLRGYRRWRFWGNTMYYNQAEIQYIRDVRVAGISGKAGLIGLFDAGKITHPGDLNDRWHYAYGGGIMIAPLSKVSVAIFYAISREENDISLRFITGL